MFTGFIFPHSDQCVRISDFQCTVVTQSTPIEDGTYSSGQKRLHVGYEMSSGGFIRLIDICVDGINYSTYYVSYTLVKVLRDAKLLNMAATLTELITTAAILFLQNYIILYVFTSTKDIWGTCWFLTR
jgi:hypothetical protein